MIRLLAVTLAVCALAATTPETIAWQGVVLKTAGGWLPVASSDEIYLFSKGAAANPSGGNPLVWLRIDWPTLQHSAPPYRSTVELAEVDCAQRVWRDRQSTEYPQNSGEGAGQSVDMNYPFSADWPPWSDSSWLPTESQYELTRDTLMKLACANA